MPIYIESKGIGLVGNPLARHEYLVYVPEGQELNYEAWKTIGAFPSDPSGLDGAGSGSNLNALFVDAIFGAANSRDAWTIDEFHFPIVGATVADRVAAGAGPELEAARQRELVYEGADEASIWASLSSTANILDDLYTYKVVDLIGASNSVVYGPTVNSNSFISSLLRHEATKGTPIGAFETNLNEPGNQTWLGSNANDVLDGRTQFASGDKAQDLFGGGGADWLIAGTGNSYLVAGKDTDRDTLIGNTGDDVLVGYFNQADLAASDQMSGGAGYDEFVIIDPDSALPGGIPDISGVPAAPTNFVHDSSEDGLSVLIDGGAGYDVLDYSFLTNDVTVDFTNGSIVNVEKYIGSAGEDIVFADEMDFGLQGGEGEDTLNYEKAADGIEVTLFDAIGLPATVRSTVSDEWTTYFSEFENFILSDQSDSLLINGNIADFADFTIDAGDSDRGPGMPDDSLDPDDVGVFADLVDISGLAITGAEEDFVTIELGEFSYSTGLREIGFVEYFGNRVDIIGFDDVIGSWGNDDITLNAYQNDVATGGGDDVIRVMDNYFNEYYNEESGGEIIAGDMLDGGEGSDTLDLSEAYVGISILNGESDTGFVIGLQNNGTLDIASNFEVVTDATGALDLSALTRDSTFDAELGEFGDITFEDADFFSVIGGLGDDTLTSGTTSISLYGGVGKDVLTAKGDATLRGGSGEDILTNNGLGKVVFAGGSGIDRIYAKTGDTVRAGENDISDILLVNGIDVSGDAYFVGQSNTRGSLKYASGSVVSFPGGEIDISGTPYNPNSNFGSNLESLTLRNSVGDIMYALTPNFVSGITLVDIEWTLRIYLEPSVEKNFFLHTASNTVRINGATADLVITGFRLGDFGINQNPAENFYNIGNIYTLGPGTYDTTSMDLGTRSDGELPDSAQLVYGNGATLDGINGNTASGQFATTSLDMDLELESVTVSGASQDTIIAFNNAIGSDFSDSISGTAGANALSGLAGDDMLDGRGGDDLLNGGAGNDTIIGGAGNDTIVYSGGDDTIEGNFAAYGNDTLDLSQYNADQVTFLNVGNDIVITTPDGSITLDNQIRWDIGHVRSNIENLIFADGTLDEAGIRARAVMDQSTAGDDAIVATKYDDLISYDGGNDTILGDINNFGNDTLDLSQYNADQVSFNNLGSDMIITTPDGIITLTYQVLTNIGHQRSNIENIIFADGSLDDAAIRERAIADQNTAGDDVTTAGAGDDTIVYQGGDDTIVGNLLNHGNDTLDLSQYNADQVSFVNDGNDIVISTPDGSIRLDAQIARSLDHYHSNIENLIFADGTLDEAGIRARAVMDQSTTGDDTIVTTKFDDVIDAGIGNDIITMGTGADIIELDFGDGVDTMTDFEDGLDIIDLSTMTGLTFGDLEINDTASGVEIIYETDGSSNPIGVLNLDGMVKANITQADFMCISSDFI